ncbi:Site-specific recombinase XerC [Sphingobium faniae]|nr:Site-specific recombinase XerC [Sphingobium faniae]
MPTARTIQYVKRTKAKGRFYYYFDTGQVDENGKRIWKRLPDPKDRAFGATYAAMLGHRSRRENVAIELTVAKLVDLYQASAQFEKLAVATQRIYRIYQTELVDKLGSAPAQRVERKDIVLMLDKMADKPAAANMVMKASSAAYSWGRKRGHITNNPFTDIDPMEVGEHQPWPEHILDAALKADGEVRLAVHLLYYTAQRIGDVASMRWRDIDGDRIIMTQEKTGKPLEIPIHTELSKELDRHPRSLSTILGKEPTKYRIDRLRTDIQAFCAELGVKVVPHGLRKNAVNALLEAGCSAAETAAISGQSLQMVEHYAKRRSQSKLGRTAILKWQRNGK